MSGVTTRPVRRFASDGRVTLPMLLHGGDMASTWVMKPEVHAERVVTLVKKSLQLDIVANDENYALAA